jgi:hypothetical protein
LEENMYRSVHLLLFVTLVACRGESTPTPPPPSTPAPPVAKLLPPPAPIDLHLGDGYQMLHPLHDGRLTVIPIVANTVPASPTKYITLEAGMARHLVGVRELGEWQVDTVRIKNKSREPVLAMSGELIVDALQDRVIARDTIIPPHSSANVNVRCVEQNRERGERTFHPGNALAELDLRQVVVQQSQPQVWAQVDQINARLGLSPPTKTYRQAAQAQPADRASSLVQQLAALPERDRMVGLAVAIDGQIMAIDRFASPELYQQLEGELLGSYVASDGGPPHEGKHTLAPADVRSLLQSPNATTTDASFVVLAPI